jgi:tyrosine-protein kinase Etk/Wzc
VTTQDQEQKNVQVDHSDEIDIGQLIGLLIDRWLTIAGVTALFLIGGVYYALSAVSIYQADALVQVEEEQQGLDVATMLGGDLGMTGSSTKAEIEIIQSRMVLGEAVARTGSDIVVTAARMPLLGQLMTNLGSESGPTGKDFGYNWASDSVVITRFEVPNFVLNVPHDLVFEGRSFELKRDGEFILNGRVGEQATDSSGEYRLFIQSKSGESDGQYTLTRQDPLSAIEALRERLSISERGKDTGILSVTLDSTSRREASGTLQEIVQIFLKQNVERMSEEAERQLEFLEKQIPSVRDELEVSENRLNEYRAQNNSVDLTFEAQSLLSQLVSLENQLTELAFSETEILQQFTKNHPRYEALLTKRTRLVEEKTKIEGQVDQLPATQQEVLSLTRDAQVNQEIFVTLLNSRQEMNLVKAGTIGNIRILDSAATQPKPIEPRKALIVMLATVLGGMLGVGGVLIARAFHHGIENPDDLEDMGLPVYGIIPLSKGSLKGSVRRQGLFQKSSEQKLKQRDLISIYEPADPVVEAIRGLRTALHFGLLESANNRIMITGPSPGVGKSFVAANLAVTIAQAGQRVLLIDSDLRKGRLHKIFDLQKPGLTEVLGQKLSLEEAVQGVSRVDGLNVLTRGETPPNPSELLMTPQLGSLLEWASVNFDMVLIDSPPVLAVTDSVIVGQLCGFALMIARFSDSSRKEVLVAGNRLRQNGVQVRGSILNAIEKRAANYYGYAGYYNYDYRASDKND